MDLRDVTERAKAMDVIEPRDPHQGRRPNALEDGEAHRRTTHRLADLAILGSTPAKAAAVIHLMRGHRSPCSAMMRSQLVNCCTRALKAAITGSPLIGRSSAPAR
jgi:hypothetical protein